MRKKVILLCMVFVLVAAGRSYACVGARPLGMGGAFIGVADDVTAVYRNPAGLINCKTIEGHGTITLNRKDQMGYRSFYAYSNGAVGISHIVRQRDNGVLENWYVLSGAREIKSAPGLSIGLNFRYEYHSNENRETQMDIGALYSKGPWGIGFMWQSLNNLRLGVSYKVNDIIVVSTDIYNTLNNPRIMLGAEIKYKALAFRAGAYAGDPTIGIGYSSDYMQIDIAAMFRQDNIILAGITFKY